MKKKIGRRKEGVATILLLHYFLLTIPYLLRAQGLLPKSSTSTPTAAENSHAILIGETVPESLIVMSENGKERPLLSYKSPNELLVVVFFSQPCASGQSLWPEFRRLQRGYRDWRVAFVAVTASSSESLAKTLKQEKLPWPVGVDAQKTVATALKISGTPEVLIIDEFSNLRYRGPLAPVRKALDTFIAQISPVKEPEPPLGESCPY